MRLQLFILILTFVSHPVFGQSISEETCQEETNHFSARGVQIATKTWRPSSSDHIKGVLIIAHGFSWHSAWFAPLAHSLVNHGFVVSSMDLQGHGLSDSVTINGKAIRGYAERFSHHVDDLEYFVKTTLAAEREKANNPALKCFMLGESMGGMLTLELERRASVRSLLSGLVLTGAVVRVSPAVLPPKPVVWILTFLSRFFPLMQIPDDSIIKTFDDAFGDLQQAVKARADPLVLLERPRLRFVAEVLNTADRLYKNLEQVESPLYILHGALDIRSEKENSIELHKRAASKDKTMEILEGMKHQLFQDQPDKTLVVINKVKEWLLERV